MSNIIEALNWRYGTQQFDTTKKLTEQQLTLLEEALRLAPSAYGLQPWHFFVIQNEDIRKTLREVAFNQPQITEASCLFVLAIQKNIDGNLVDQYMKSIIATQSVSEESLEKFRTMIQNDIKKKGNLETNEWATRQLYLALGIVLAAAAAERIDTCPMEGFDREKFDKILDLESRGLESRVLVAAGFRAEDDRALKKAKVRYSEDELFSVV